jgi:HSP20 family protein
MENRNQNAIVKRESGAIVKCPEPVRRIVEPPADIYETDNDFILRVDIPGARKDDISINLDSGNLTIKAVSGHGSDPDSELIFSEIGNKCYEREFRVGRGIDADGISARYENGILTLTMPKTEGFRARNIKIN